jgi:predicted deacetylase
LLVPNFHRAFPITSDPKFVAWCRRPRPFRIEWALHGYYHVEDIPDQRRRAGPVNWLARRLMTAGEGEFLALSAEEQRDRLARGREMYSAALDGSPRAFVAPAWLFNRALAPELVALGFRFTEDHWRVMDLQQNRSCVCPAITWATRTTLRRLGSRVMAPMSFAVCRHMGSLRLAIHPFDMDHPQTADQVRRLLSRTVDTGHVVDYDGLFV